eukprot:403335346
MKERVQTLQQKQFVTLPWIGTFHSLSIRLLKMFDSFTSVGLKMNFKFVDEDEKCSFVKNLLDILPDQNLREKLKCLQSNPRENLEKSVCNSISNLKCNVKFPNDNLQDQFSGFDKLVHQTIYPVYQKQLQEDNQFDFDDMLLKLVQLPQTKPKKFKLLQKQFKYILVDEVQDLNNLQETWLKYMAGDGRGLTCVGDDDQLIYGFQGATGNLIQNFKKTYPESYIIKLEQNYRSTKSLIDSANNLIEFNNCRINKKLWTQNSQGQPPQITQYQTNKDEIKEIVKQIKLMISNYQNQRRLQSFGSYGNQEQVVGSQIAILTRTNKQAQNFEELLREHDVPYEMPKKSMNFLKKEEIQLALKFLTILYDQGNDEILSDIILKLKGFGKITVKKLLENASQQKQSLLKYCQILLGMEIGDDQERNNLQQQNLINKVNLQDQNSHEDKKAQEENKEETIVFQDEIFFHNLELKSTQSQSDCEDTDNQQLLSVIHQINRQERRSKSKSKFQSQIIKLNSNQKDSLKYFLLILQNHINQRENLLDYISLQKYLRDAGFYYMLKKYYKNYKVAKERIQELLERVGKFSDFESFILYIKGLNEIKNIQEENIDRVHKIKLLTIHSAKGLEFDYVFLPFWNQNDLPFKFKDPDVTQDEHEESERRLAFVALTRARKHAYISCSSVYVDQKFTRKIQPSQFIQEVK